jgi:predicted nucleic acid-binding protein
VLYYLDTCILIYWAEDPAPFDARVRNHVAALQAAGHRFAVSDFSRLECLVKPLGTTDGPLLLDYEQLLLAPDVRLVPLAAATYTRAAAIRGSLRYPGGRRYSVPDSLHLAAAVEGGCDRFLTNDGRLAGFPDLVVEVLP